VVEGHGIQHQLSRQERVRVATRSDQRAEHACMAGAARVSTGISGDRLGH
jgi:hypothetical protein